MTMADSFAVPTRGRTPSTATAAAAVLGVALLAADAPNLRELAARWGDDPNYSHGYLVSPIELPILWQRRGDLPRAGVAPHPLGWAALLAVLAGRAWLFEQNERWIEAATIPVAAAALVLAFGGFRLLRWALPAVAFLWLMLPLPPRINLVLAGPLQRVATVGSTTLLQALGLPVLAEGNVILIGAERLEVERACNGLSMIMAFVTLIAATVVLVRTRPLWERAVLLLSTVPIALVSNILRIAITAWAYYQFGPRAVVFPRWSPICRGWTVEHFVHDTAGLAMIPIALALIVLELRLLSWLVVEEQVSTRPRLVIPPAYVPPRPAKKKPGPGPGPAPTDEL